MSRIHNAYNTVGNRNGNRRVVQLLILELCSTSYQMQTRFDHRIRYSSGVASAMTLRKDIVGTPARSARQPNELSPIRPFAMSNLEEAAVNLFRPGELGKSI